MSEPKRSPMIEQYFEMKARNPEAILLSRVGDFYEAYGEDAETISRALQIALTGKDSGSGTRVAMAGVPHHALDTYLRRLVEQRFVVALAEQMEEPRPNKLVRRDVVRVVTPGTLVEEHLLDGKRNNYLAALAYVDDTFGLLYCDVSTGESVALAFSAEASEDELLADLARIAPSEIVLDIPGGGGAALRAAIEALGARIAALPISSASARVAQPIDGFSLGESLAMARAGEVLDAYLARTGLIGAQPLRSRTHYQRNTTQLAIDPSTRKHLELLAAAGANDRATLLFTLDACSTSMGSRLLARRISAPSVVRDEIERRLDELESLHDAHALRATLRDALRHCFDLERIAQKIALRRAGPRDCASLRRTFEAMAVIPSLLPPALARISESLLGFDDVLAELTSVLVEEPPARLSDGGVIRADADPELAECIELRADARGRIAALEERERERTGIKTLKVKYASAFGYAIEINHAYSDRVPADYIRRQTLTGSERYVTQELKELELAISTAQSRQERLEQRLFAELVERIAVRSSELAAAGAALAELDVAAALAEQAATRGYVRPQFFDESRLEVVDGRHPVMEAVVQTHFVPNDVRLLEREHRFILLTGPNMGGKSTYLRQIGLLVIMAQLGSFVPATSMRLGIVDRIFTRIGAGDDLASGQSTFFMEMTEASNILRRCTARSLLLVDEVGRGTGTIDGLAIAQAICEYLLGLNDGAPMTCFA
ncbi:MAG TPA: DNA mismatch repair protein MutS, partial [Candidatus Dormibacteraeota bacterium]|nr:DNA mismatch repair protein MutS [Candidatus Dormibacteraeota bacterium]